MRSPRACAQFLVGFCRAKVHCIVDDIWFGELAIFAMVAFWNLTFCERNLNSWSRHDPCLPEGLEVESCAQRCVMSQKSSDDVQWWHEFRFAIGILKRLWMRGRSYAFTFTSGQCQGRRYWVLYLKDSPEAGGQRLKNRVRTCFGSRGTKVQNSRFKYTSKRFLLKWIKS